MIFNELATNSAKYGSLTDNGALDIAAHEIDQDWILIRWSEHGIQITDTNTGETGFGNQLLDFTTRDIGAELTRDGEGRTLTIDIKIPRNALEMSE
ncbi:hypothetical protein ACFO5X_07250 [Seohaeicola nanhaiensis]|uniref:histidine kinase n=1 Tax=Seohaeicola nanhaiensis TaxID=1387282 RepID=A0ABV9KE29_9RHOB